MRGQGLLKRLQEKYRRKLCQEKWEEPSVESWVPRQTLLHSCTCWSPQHLGASSSTWKTTFCRHLLLEIKVATLIWHWDRDCHKTGDENGDCLLCSQLPYCCSQFWVRVCWRPWRPKSWAVAVRPIILMVALPLQKEERASGPCKSGTSWKGPGAALNFLLPHLSQRSFV